MTKRKDQKGVLKIAFTSSSCQRWSKVSPTAYLTRDGTMLLFDGAVSALKVTLLLLAVNTRPTKSTRVDEDLLTLPRLLLSDGVAQLHVFVRTDIEHAKILAADAINTVIDIEQWELRGNHVIVEVFTDAFARLEQDSFLAEEKAIAERTLLECIAERQEEIAASVKAEVEQSIRRGSQRRFSSPALSLETDTVLSDVTAPVITLRPPTLERQRPISAPSLLQIDFGPSFDESTVSLLPTDSRSPTDVGTSQQTISDCTVNPGRGPQSDIALSSSSSAGAFPGLPQAQSPLFAEEYRLVSSLRNLVLRVTSTARSISESTLQERVKQLKHVVDILSALPGDGVTRVDGIPFSPSAADLVPPPAYTAVTVSAPSPAVNRPALPPPYTPSTPPPLPAPVRPNLPPPYTPAPPTPRPPPSPTTYTRSQGIPLNVVRPPTVPPPRPPGPVPPLLQTAAASPLTYTTISESNPGCRGLEGTNVATPAVNRLSVASFGGHKTVPSTQRKTSNRTSVASLNQTRGDFDSSAGPSGNRLSVAHLNQLIRDDSGPNRLSVVSPNEIQADSHSPPTPSNRCSVASLTELRASVSQAPMANRVSNVLLIQNRDQLPSSYAVNRNLVHLVNPPRDELPPPYEVHQLHVGAAPDRTRNGRAAHFANNNVAAVSR
ncbi:hypothetical protein HDU93_003293 [Gonapodya sp. JEL0774]|nr:hypothetical protein HDU93_003293 [Gonapodya sp. JEL0774]